MDDLAACTIVVEAIPEVLDLKRSLFEDLERIVSPAAVLATNTSALPVAEIGSRLARPERFLGLHFFNPPTAMKLVEIVRTATTGARAIAAATDFSVALERTPVLVADTAGFIVNRIARPFYLQAMRALDREVADVATLDALARGAGFPMGPFALMDLIGIDVNAAVSRAASGEKPAAAFTLTLTVKFSAIRPQKWCCRNTTRADRSSSSIPMAFSSLWRTPPERAALTFRGDHRR